MIMKNKILELGVSVIAVPKFAAGQQFGQMVVADIIYEKLMQLCNSYA